MLEINEDLRAAISCFTTPTRSGEIIINNVYYHDVAVNCDTLVLLPNDSDLTNLFALHMSSVNQLEISLEQDDGPYNAHLHRTSVPTMSRGLTE